MLTRKKKRSNVANAIQHDIDNLKSSAASMATNLQKTGRHKIEELQEAVEDGMHTLREYSAEGLNSVDEQIKENPRRSMLFAFAAGVIANSLIRRAD